MKLFRGVFLPLFLCAAILSIGFFAPQLFLRRTPDFKDDPQTVSIAGTKNPMYVAADTELILSPWDQYDANNALAARNYMDGEQLERLSFHLYDYLPLFLPEGAALPDDSDDLMSFVRTNDGSLFFMEDYRLAGKSGDYLLSFAALYECNYFCTFLSIDVVPADGDTQAMRHPEALETNFHIAVEFWQSAYPRTDIAAMLAKANYEDSTVTEFIRFWALLDSLPPAGAFSPWSRVLEICQDVYAFNYEDRSYITLTNETNYTATMIYDKKAGVFVGFSLDPALLYLTD